MWLQASAEVIEPRRKKGKSIPHRDSSETALPPRECIQLGHAVVQGVLAVAGDAARLLQWDCDTTPAVATLSLASASLSWANELCRTSPSKFHETLTGFMHLTSCLQMDKGRTSSTCQDK